MSLLSNFMKPVSLYNPTKDKKTKAFSCLERVYRDRPVAWNGLTCIRNIFEAMQIVLRKNV